MKVVIATHVYTTGPAQDLRDYFIGKKVEKVLFIGHPLFYDPKLKGSGFERYEKGKLMIKNYSPISKLPSFISYFKDIWQTVKWVKDSGEKWNLFVGSDNLNALSGLILKRMGLVNKVIYYVIDYNPYRFDNVLLNLIYHKIDQFCVKYADETWNLSPRMEWGRKKYFDFSGGNQKVVPVGVWLDRINLKVKKIPNSLVFMGHVTKKQGIQNVIREIPKIIKKIPRFTFIIIGGGDYLGSLEALAKNLKVSRYVEFKGYIKDHREIERLLPQYSLAIAPYEKFDENGHLSFTYFADPAKIKLYLACGLPVLVSDVSYNAKDIEEQKCGMIFGDNLSKEIISLLIDSHKILVFQKNSLNYAKRFDWKKIFSNTLLTT